MKLEVIAEYLGKKPWLGVVTSFGASMTPYINFLTDVGKLFSVWLGVAVGVLTIYGWINKNILKKQRNDEG